MPDALELPLTAELGPAAALRSELRDRVRTVELECAVERVRTSRRVLGRRAVLAQSRCEGPVTVDPRRNLRPGIATRSQWSQIVDNADHVDERQRVRPAARGTP